MFCKEQPVYIVEGLPVSNKSGGSFAENWLVERLRENGFNVEIFIADGHQNARNVTKIIASRAPGLCLVDGMSIFWVSHTGLKIIKARHSLCLILHIPFSIWPYKDEPWLKEAVPSTCLDLQEYEKSLWRFGDSLLIFGEKCAEIIKSPEFGFGDVPTKVLLPPVQIYARRMASKKTKRQNLIFVSVGTLSRRKNQHILIRALSLLVSTNKLVKPRLLLIGSVEIEPSYAKEVRALAKECSTVDVEITGPLSIQETHERVVKGDCALFPSQFESFGMAAVEAACMGIPVISSIHAAPRDMLPESTVWVDSESSDQDVDAWVKALELWIKSKSQRETLALEKADRILEKKNPEEYLRRLLATQKILK